MDLPGVTVTDVDFQPAKVVVTVRLRRSKLSCPACGFTTRARYDTRPVSSAWRHLDLGRWRLEVRADLRRIDCPTHGARTEGVPFARAGSRFTNDRQHNNRPRERRPPSFAPPIDEHSATSHDRLHRARTPGRRQRTCCRSSGLAG